MRNNKQGKYSIIIVTIISCIIMALVETFIEPLYVLKSATKAVVFLLLPLVSMKLFNIKVSDRTFILNKQILIRLLVLGFFIYFVIIGAYILTRNIFDYVDEKSQSIYNSWIIHMFADFAIMTIWYIHI